MFKLFGDEPMDGYWTVACFETLSESGDTQIRYST